MDTGSCNAAEAFAAHWIEAWNSHDIDAILSHYVDDVEFLSPLAMAEWLDSRHFAAIGVQVLRRNPTCISNSTRCWSALQQSPSATAITGINRLQRPSSSTTRGRS